MIMLVVLLMALSVPAHFFILQSDAFTSAVSAYQSQNPAVQHSDISLCYSCRKKISYGNGTWHYRFTLLVKKDGSEHEIKVHSQAQPNDQYVVAFE